ncbi:hypothetical protein KC221_22490, partial [Mycobacterium tuberculosis]|nr:hypothetical protein [Mycobacterium tuberculosis]
TDRFKLRAGVRYTQDKKDFSASVLQAVPFGTPVSGPYLANTDVNDVWEVRHGEVEHTTFDALDLGFERVTKDALRGGGPQENAAIMRSVLAGEASAVRDIVLI